MKTSSPFLKLTITSHLLALLILVPRPLSSSKPKPTTTIEFSIITTGVGPCTTHLVQLRLGSPPQTMYVIPDTGSKATWVYCGRSPYRQHDNIYSGTTRSVFGFRRSSTFLPVRCSSTGSCFENGNCSLRHRLCRYRHEYVDGTLTNGHWVRDSLTVKTDGGVEVKVSGVVIGCSSRRSSNLVDADGILGLSPTSFSVPASLMKKSSNQHVFSYFISTTKQSKKHDVLIFGKTNRPLFRRHKMQHIKLNPDHRDHTFAFVKITNLLINDVNLDIPPETWEFDPKTGEGGVVIDTGTTFTYLPEAAFNAVHDVYANHLMGKFQRSSSEITDVDLCVDSRDVGWVGIDLPELVVEFEGGARLAVDEEGLFYEDGGGMRCLGVRKGGDGVGIIVGSLFQTGYFWEYDLKMRTLRFARVDDV